MWLLLPTVAEQVIEFPRRLVVRETSSFTSKARRYIHFKIEELKDAVARTTPPVRAVEGD